jgi:glutathione peroxidase
MTTITDFTARAIDGREVPLSEFDGKVLLVVNTASKCGFTPQYEGLEALHQKYGPHGFAVLGFPCNQFGAQEPGDAGDRQFLQADLSTSFPDVRQGRRERRHAHPLFKWLKKAAPGLLGSEAIKWNFTKFLIDRRGQVQERFAPTTKPEALGSEIEKLLTKG